MTEESKFLDLDAVEVGGEPACSFQFGGQEWHTRPKDDIPWPMVKRFFLAQESGEMGKVIVEVDDFFRNVLEPAEVEDFMALTEDSDLMTIKRFTALLTFVAEAVFGLPTEPSGTSPAGRRPTRPSSRASSSSPVSVIQTDSAPILS